MPDSPVPSHDDRDIGDVLVVDDEPANVLSILSALDGFDFRFQTAYSGQEALRHLLQEDFALILLDVRMPGLSGFETARLIRARGRSRQTPIIFITAQEPTDSSVLTAYELGAVDFLFKPIEPVVLRAKVKVFVDLERRRAEISRQAELLRAHEQRQNAQALAQERFAWRQEVLRIQLAQERNAADASAKRADALEKTVAERERVERELARINSELQDADRRKNELLAILAHELRNPLAPLSAGLELLRARLDETAGPSSAFRMVEVMDRQINHMSRMIDDLLDVSRVASGKVRLQKVHIDLGEVIDEAVNASEKAITERRQHLTVVASEVRPIVHGDPLRLTQVIANLLNNASRYTHEGGDIEVRCQVQEGQVVLSVSDNGEGMEPELSARIFDMFVQKSAGRGGLGIGLSLVRHLVDMHGGRVTAHSDGPDRGSCFSVALPLSSATTGQRPLVRPPPTRQAPLRVVLIDDNPDIRTTMRDLLMSWGHSVELGEDGPEGLDLIVGLEPDIAIVDLALPQLDGYAVAARARARLGSGLRLVAMSGFSADDSRKRAFEAGFDQYVVKPASVRSLERALAGAWDAPRDDVLRTP